VRVPQNAEDSLYSRVGKQQGAGMDICHQHNLVDQAATGKERTFGIRVSLPVGDTLRNVLGNDWEQYHWYRGETERDTALLRMAIHHGYYRDTDSPTQILEKVTR
jgi:hypothetical protein